MVVVLFQFQPNLMGKYFFLAIWALILVWLLYGLIKEIRDIRKSEIDFEIVEEHGKWYSVKYIVIGGKRRDLGKREII